MIHGTNLKGFGYIYDLDVQRVKNHWAFQNYKKGVTPKKGEDEEEEIKTPIEEHVKTPTPKAEENPEEVEVVVEEEKEPVETETEEEEKEEEVIFSNM